MLEKGLEPPKHLDIDPTSKLYKWLVRLWGVFPRIRTYTVTIDPASIGANTISEQNFTVTGLTTQDIVFVNKPSYTSQVGILACRVSAANTLTIAFIHQSGGSVNPGSEDYFVVAIRR